MGLQEDIKTGKRLLFDGGMGTMLAQFGLGLSGGVNNLDHGDVVTRIHQAYLAAGSDCIYANTFSLNRIYAQSHGLQIDLALANQKGVEAAKKAANGSAYVLGDLGPTGQMLAPMGKGDPEEIYRSYLEQAVCLAASGVDGFVVETMFDLEESLLGVKACLEAAPDLPVIATMTFSTLVRGGRTIMGNKAVDCANKLTAAGVSVVGANCGDLTPSEMATIVTNMKEVGTPILVKPNAGKPHLNGTETTYDMKPQEFAAGILECFAAGAQFAGGCCGTTPEHIAAVKEAMARIY